MVIQFDLKSVPSSTPITRATLSLYCYSSWFFKNNTKYLYTLTTAWSQKTVCYNSPWSKRGGDFVSPALATNTNTETKVWEEFDVTKPVTDAVKNGKQCNGFIICMPFYGISQHYTAWYYSSENDDKTLRPKLTLAAGTTAVSQPQHIEKARTLFKISCRSGVVSFTSSRAGTVSLLTSAGKCVARFHNAAPGSRMVSLKTPIAQGVYVAVFTTAGGMAYTRPVSVLR